MAFLAADSSFIKSILSDGDDEEKQITLIGVETDILSSYVSLLFNGLLQLGDNRYLLDRGSIRSSPRDMG